MNKKISILLGVFIIILLLFIIFHFITLQNECENEIDNFNVLTEIPQQLTEEEINKEIIRINEDKLKNKKIIKNQAEIYNKNLLESVKYLEQKLNNIDNMIKNIK
jgi:hypothetical protein